MVLQISANAVRALVAATALALATTVAAPAAAAVPGQFIVSAAPEPMARIHIKNADLTVRIALGFDKALLLNLPAATRAELRAFPLIGKQTFKSRLLPGGESTVRGNIYDVAVAGLPDTTVPTLWFDRTLTEDSDGVISALAIPGDSVVVTLPAAPPGGMIYTITRTGKGDAAMRAVIGGTKVNVILDLRSPETIFNGSAARLLETAGLVRRAGTVGLWRPFPGVALPFERLIPTPGAVLLGLPLIAPAARVTEVRARELDAKAKAGTSTADQDEDAITVTANAAHKPSAPWILIGRDVLGHCSRIELDRPGQRWVLTCAFASGVGHPISGR